MPHDPDKTDTKWTRRYQAAELWLDDVLMLVLRSPWSFAVFAGYSAALLLFGFWCGLKL